jgi:hypothetical protein
MGETSALVVVGENKNLGFASKTTERGSMQDAIAVTLETCAVWIFFFGDGSVAGADGTCCQGRHGCVFGGFSRHAVGNIGSTDASPRVCVRKRDALSG